FVLDSVNSTGPLDWHCVLAEPKMGPGNGSAILQLTPDLPQTPGLVIEIVEQNALSNPLVLLVGSGGRFAYEMPDHSLELSQAFTSYLASHVSQSRPGATTHATLHRSLFANLLTTLAVEATNIHRPLELRMT